MRRVGVTALTSLVAAVLVLILLYPASGVDTDPPECYSVFDYVVPCAGETEGWGFAVIGAVAAGGLVILGSTLGRRDRQ